MKPMQALAIKLLREDSRSDIYEGAHPMNIQLGSGRFYVSYQPHSTVDLSREDIAEMVNARLIKQKWPGCYQLTGNCGEGK